MIGPLIRPSAPLLSVQRSTVLSMVFSGHASNHSTQDSLGGNKLCGKRRNENTQPARQQSRRWRAIVAGALACSGCATTVLDVPLTVTAPVSKSTVVDRRADFAAALRQEFAKEHLLVDPTQWLRLPPDVSTGAESLAPANASVRSTSILIAPGILGDCVADQSVPFGDGKERPAGHNYSAAYGIYNSLGFATVRAVPLLGRASSATNARLLVDAILAEQAKPEVADIVVVGYSKGVPDSLEAISLLTGENGGFPSKLRVLVSVAGVVNGTVLADRFQGLYEALTGKFNPLGCTPSQGGELESLTKRVRLEWLRRHTIPQQVRLYSLVASNTESDVAPGLAESFRQLSRVGDRNDGQMVVSDAILPGSMLLGEVRSDHWKFVLPLESLPAWAVRALVNDKPFPRSALFRAIVRTVQADLSQAPLRTPPT